MPRGVLESSRYATNCRLRRCLLSPPPASAAAAAATRCMRAETIQSFRSAAAASNRCWLLHTVATLAAPGGLGGGGGRERDVYNNDNDKDLIAECARRASPPTTQPRQSKLLGTICCIFARLRRASLFSLFKYIYLKNGR